MGEAHLKFEREEIEGTVAVGTYLADATKRIGIRFEGDCIQEKGIHFCAVVLENGSKNVSPMTELETAYFALEGSMPDERLSCQARIEKDGDITIMTKKKKDVETEPTAEEQSEQFKKDFAEMPLEKKISSLVQLEAIALGETMSFIVNSPYMVFDKVLDVMAEFGLKKEEEKKKAVRPKEHESSPETHINPTASVDESKPQEEESSSPSASQ